MKNLSIFKKGVFTAALVATLCGVTSSCEDKIDTSNRYTFTGETVASFLENHSDLYSSFIYILQKGDKFSLMKAYGTYTCFAPTNEAIAKYLAEQDSIWQATKDLPNPIWTGITSPDLYELTDSMCKVIAQTHLLPEPYLTTDMEGDVIPTMNMNDRYLSITYDVDENNYNILMVNGDAQIIYKDEEVENGVVHTLSKVLNPSSNTLPTQIGNHSYFSIFFQALTETGLDDKLQGYKDFSYTDGDKYAGNFDGNGDSPYPATRYFGFSAFVEPDSIFNLYNIHNLNELKAKCKEWYPNATDDDPTSVNNALYQFVGYHLINKKVQYTRLVCYELTLTDYKSEVNMVKRADRYEYYESMNPNTLFKVTRPLSNSKASSYVLLNYNKTLFDKEYAAGYFTNASYSAYDKENKHYNIRILDPNKVKEQYPDFNQIALNGFIHVLDDIMLYNEDMMAGYVLNEIMRFDFSSIVPEFTNNDIRWCSRGKAGLLKKNEFYIPDKYCSSVVYNTEETRLYYLCPNQGWHNYQGDEMMGLGAFDFKYKMPPVPAGTYEIRMGYSANSNRHVIQFYLDDEVTGIPVDLRILANNANIGWVADKSTDDNGVANDKAMKNRGYLKGPTTFYYNGSTLARDDNGVIRKVITTKYLTAGEHWIRFKNVKEDDDGKAQFMHDYLEIVPMSFIRNEELSLEDKRK